MERTLHNSVFAPFFSGSYPHSAGIPGVHGEHGVLFMEFAIRTSLFTQSHAKPRLWASTCSKKGCICSKSSDNYPGSVSHLSSVE